MRKEEQPCDGSISDDEEQMIARLEESRRILSAMIAETNFDAVIHMFGRWNIITHIVVLAVILILCSSGTARPDQHQKSSTQQHQAEPEQEHAQILAVQSSEAALREAISTLERQSRAAEKQAQAEQESWKSPSVLVQLGLLIVGIAYSLFAALQWTAIKEQARLAERALTVAERPHFIFTDFELKKPGMEVGDLGAIYNHVAHSIKDCVRVEFQLKNCGRSPGWITKLASRLKIDERLPDVAQYSDQVVGGWSEAPTGVPLTQDESLPLVDVLSGMGGLGKMARYEADSLRQEKKFLWLYGEVEYRDILGNRHRSGFCLKFDITDFDAPMFDTGYEAGGPASYWFYE